MVSARKYRPPGFNEVIGQSHITTTLKNAIDNNHLAQALLFCGPRGVGKTTCARIVARMINGFEENNVDASNAFNIYELDAASNNSVEDIRNLIDQVRYTPQQGKFKVYIIDEVHMLSNQAFNAFLKTLEEPPPYAIFILATTEKHKVIPTILSRCQIYDFNRIEISDIIYQLKKIAESEKIEVEEEALHLIAQKADGALRDALSLFDLIVTFSSGKKVIYQDTIKNLHILDYDYFFKITDFLFKANLSEAMLLFDEILSNGFDGHNFIVGLSEHLRDLMVCKDEQTIILLTKSDNVKQKYLNQAKGISLSFCLSALNILNICDINYKVSKNQRLHVELALMKLSYLNQAISLAQTPNSEVKKKNELNLFPQIKTDKIASFSSTGATTPAASVSSPGSIGNISNPKKKIPSFKNIFEKKKKSTENTSLTKVEKRHKTFDINKLTAAWNDFISSNNISGATLSLLNNKYILKSEKEVEIQLKNPIETDLLAKINDDLVHHLRNKLENDYLIISGKTNMEVEQKKAYTDTEIFNEMAEKNPNLLKLKEALGLIITF